MRATFPIFALTISLFSGASVLNAQVDVDRQALVETALAEVRATYPALSVDRIQCVVDQAAIVATNERVLSYPCELRDVVEDASDAAMLVNLLLVEPVQDEPGYQPRESIIERAAAFGTAVVGAAVENGPDPRIVDRARAGDTTASPGLAAYAPAGSRTIRAEASRLRREEEMLRSSARTDERARERARDEREEERMRRAEYASVTNFLELTNLQKFCPADGRMFLRRASEYATSPIQEDRAYGLWADDKRHILEPYLNDLSRCR